MSFLADGAGQIWSLSSAWPAGQPRMNSACSLRRASKASGRLETGTQTRSGGKRPSTVWKSDGSDQGDEVAAGITHSSVKRDQIPALPLIDYSEPCSIIGPCNDGRGSVRSGADI